MPSKPDQEIRSRIRQSRSVTGMDCYPGSEIDAEAWRFLKAVDEYKRKHQRPYLTDAEVLAIARSVGFRKVAEPYDVPVATRDAREQ